jgi:hypothetical protein
MMFRYRVSAFDTVPVAPFITGIIFGYTFDVCCISIAGSVWF